MSEKVVKLTPDVLRDICEWFEEQYGMTSPEFYSRYLKGEFVGMHDAYRWSGYWKTLLKMKEGSRPPVIQKDIDKELLAAAG